MRDITSDVVDLRDDLAAYVRYVEVVCEVVEALDSLRWKADNGGAQSVQLQVSVSGYHGRWTVVVDGGARTNVC
jgi:hypothetical protein